MKIIQVIPAFRLAGAEIMCENLCVALKNAGETVIAVSLYSEQTAITERLVKNGVRIVFLEKKPGSCNLREARKTVQRRKTRCGPYTYLRIQVCTAGSSISRSQEKSTHGAQYGSKGARQYWKKNQFVYV